MYSFSFNGCRPCVYFIIQFCSFSKVSCHVRCTGPNRQLLLLQLLLLLVKAVVVVMMVVVVVVVVVEEGQSGVPGSTFKDDMMEY